MAPTMRRPGRLQGLSSQCGRSSRRPGFPGRLLLPASCLILRPYQRLLSIHVPSLPGRGWRASKAQGAPGEEFRSWGGAGSVPSLTLPSQLQGWLCGLISALALLASLTNDLMSPSLPPALLLSCPPGSLLVVLRRGPGQEQCCEGALPSLASSGCCCDGEF